jgi:guanylate kinase
VEGKARLFVVSGPSGTGKGTLVKHLRSERRNLGLTVSATTREPRAGEVDGVDYRFLSDGEFDDKIANGEFLEWANVHGHRYGTLRCDAESQLAAGKSLILEIDVQGGLQIKKIKPDAVLVFVEPPSQEELEKRLRGRGTEDEATIELRLKNAAHEYELAEQYDVRIVNDDIDRATEQLADLLDSYEK